jgi:3-hydroxybutyrate dehydrogenase
MLNPEEISEMIKVAEKEFGEIDILVNNAGVQHVAPIEEFDTKHWNDIIGINLTAAFHTSKGVWSKMKEKKWGRIINIASAHGLIASEFKCAYVASKHGLVGLTKVLALEGAECGITVNAICPGYVKTPLVEKQVEEQATSHHISKQKVVDEIMLAEQPIKKFTQVEDIAEMAYYLCSPNSTTITGSCLSIDGGWTAH